MSSYAAILPGARVRTADGFIGTVERLENSGNVPGRLPDVMVVRSDDSHWRYAIPLMLVSVVSQEMFHTVVRIKLPSDALVHYITDDLYQNQTPTELVPNRADGNTTPTSDEAPVLTIPLVHEELVAQKRPAILGAVRVHKGVRTTEQHMSLPVFYEEAVIEHIAADQFDENAPKNPNEVIIPVLEERLVVQKQTVVREYIRIRKDLMAQQANVRDTVREEFVEFSEQRQPDADARRLPPLLREETPVAQAEG